MRLAEDPLTASQLAERLGCDPRAVTMLLDALAALDLLEKRQDRYSVPPELRPWLIEGDPQSVLPMLRHMGNLVRGWSQLAWTVKEGSPAPRQPSIRGAAADRESFIAAMHAISGPMADEVVAAARPA